MGLDRHTVEYYSPNTQCGICSLPLTHIPDLPTINRKPPMPHFNTNYVYSSNVNEMPGEDTSLRRHQIGKLDASDIDPQ